MKENHPPADNHNRTELEIIGGPLDGLLFRSDHKIIRLGRFKSGSGDQPHNHLAIPFDPFASNQHARLFEDKEQWYLEDMDSKNGTWFRDEKLTPHEPIPLVHGQVFTIGNTVVRFAEELRRRPRPNPDAQKMLSDATRMVVEAAYQRTREQELSWFGTTNLFIALVQSQLALVRDFFKRAGMSADRVVELVDGWGAWELDVAHVIRRYLRERKMERQLIEQPPLTPRVHMIYTLADESRKASGEPLIQPLNLLMAFFIENGSQPAMALDHAGLSAEDLLRTTESVLAEIHEMPANPGLANSDEVTQQWPLPPETRDEIRELTERIHTTQTFLRKQATVKAEA